MIILTDETDQEREAREAAEYRAACRVKALAELANIQRTLNSHGIVYTVHVTFNNVIIIGTNQDQMLKLYHLDLGFVIRQTEYSLSIQKVINYD